MKRRGCCKRVPAAALQLWLFIYQAAPSSWRARVTGGMAGSLLLRSMERSERVYNAMLSRGYNGDLPEINTQILSRKNQAVLALGICLFAILLALSYLLQGQVG